MEKKGSSWGTWFWIILFMIIITSVMRYSYYRQAMYDDLYKDQLLQQQQEDYYQQQREEELQRQYEQEQYEKMLREEQRQTYEEELRRQQQEDYYQQQYKQQPTSIPQIQAIKCTDSDSGKDYYTKGYITHSDGTIEYDECETGDYKDYVWEHYCTSSGTGSLNYKCPYGCSEGKCNSEPQQYPYDISLCKGSADCFIGTVNSIVDGDTLYVNWVSIRLALTNTPELGENGFSEAKQFTKTLCPVGSSVLVDEDDGQTSGSYGRTIAVVYCGNHNLNEQLLELGYGQIWKSYCEKSEFKNENWAIKFGC